VTRPELRSVHGLERIWFEVGATQQYYPVLHSAFWVEHRLWGDATLGYHLLNVLLHATAAWLFVVILRRLGVPGAWLAGFIFALHPVCVESVAWISEQKNTLSAVFYLLSALTYLRWRERAERTDGRDARPCLGSSKILYVLATVLFILALLSKTVTATLPAALLVVIWWRQGRLSWRRDIVPLLPWFALGIAAGIFTAWVERWYVGAHGTAYDLGGLQRCLLAGRVIWFYLGKLLWPANLIFIYPRWTVSGSAAWQYAYPLGTLAVLALLWRWRRRSRGPLAAALLFIGSLFPALGFFNAYPFRYSFVADHFQYLACLGLIASAAAGWTKARERLSSGVGTGLAIALLGTLALLTWRQSRIYGDGESLYRDTIAKNPQCWMAQNNLGNILRASGRRHDALLHYLQALLLNPDYADARCNFGIALSDEGRLPEAIAEYQQALRLDPNFPEAHYNLALALEKEERLPEAIEEYRQALRLKSDRPEIRNNLGNALAKTGRIAEAREQYEAALKMRPDYPEAHYNLGIVLRIQGRLPDAMVQFREALRLRPGYADAHFYLGVVLDSMGRLGEAVEEYGEAIRANPGDVEAVSDLGVALARSRRFAEAIVQFEKAVRLKPDDPGAHNNLALALRAAGRLPEAEAQFEQARRLRSGRN
jgi:tetratricopeptide (TPR) repeat protein